MAGRRTRAFILNVWIPLLYGYCQWQLSLPQHHLGIQLIHIPEHKWMAEAQIENHVNMFSLLFVYVCVCVFEKMIIIIVMNAKENGTSKRNSSKALGAPHSF